MSRESQTKRKERTARVLQLLAGTYPDAHCELDHANSLQLLIATILSAQCSDAQVNRVTPSLFRTCKSAADFTRTPQSELEEIIRRIGLFRSKARSIKACCDSLIQDHGGEVPHTMNELLRLKGVGRKTANVILGNAFGINEGIVVDTHVARLSRRLGLSQSKTPDKIELDLMKLVPRQQWGIFSHWLIWHGRRRCNARNPDCVACELRDECPSRDTHTRKALTR